MTETLQAGIRTAPGARVTEDALLTAVEAFLPSPGTFPTAEDLSLPLRILVPSRKLRLHLTERLLSRRGRPVAGVRIQTLHALALEILERCGESPGGSPLLFDVLVERLARSEPLLAEPLELLLDGYLPVSGTVRDLLDAGLEWNLLSAAEELLEAEGPARASRRELQRAQALLRVAAAADRSLELTGAGRATRDFQKAQHLLEQDPESALPSRAVLVHGFADATGRALDLLQALVRTRGAKVFVDLPPDPAGAGSLETAFPSRFLERFGKEPEAAVASLLATPAPPARPERIEATDPEAEVLAVADRIRDLLDTGETPEKIAVVARDLVPYELSLWTRFTELAIPYSALGGRGSFTFAGRRVEALLGLLSRGEETPTDAWLEAVILPDEEPSPAAGAAASRSMELRIAFHSVGAGRLAQAAGLDPEPWIRRGAFPLPLLQGLDDEEGDPDEEASEPARRGLRRTLPAPALRDAIRRAGRTLEQLRDWPLEQTLDEHFRCLHRLLEGCLGWRQDQAGGQGLDTLAELRRQCPGPLELTFREFLRLLRSAFEGVGFEPLGGRGGGVQVLGVTEARGLTFEHLFVLGLARDQFPRPVREDPLLPDDLRLLLRDLLPDIPIKRRGFEEERYLFAQLLSASPRITLCRPLATAEGRPGAASPLWERLRWSLRELPPVHRASSLYAGPDPEGRLRDPRTHAVLAGLFGDREAFRRRFPVALRKPEPAAARLRILDEMDPDLSSPEGRRTAVSLGPYLGLVGPASEGDPRQRPLSVTHLEGMAACSWQTFLRRLLRLAPTPDSLQALPQISPLLVGQLVHAVLDGIVDAGKGKGLEELLSAEPTEVFWPSDEELQEVVAWEAERLLREEGVAFARLAKPLALRAGPYLEIAREALWGEGPLRATGSEVEGSLALPTASEPDPFPVPAEVSFRADLVYEAAEGRRIVDLKTGRPLCRNKTPKGRRAELLRAVGKGERLQAVAYLLAAEQALGAPSGVEGAYLFLDPHGEPYQREVAVGSGDDDVKEVFARAAAAAGSAWSQGAFPPRLVDPKTDKEPRRCQYCTVAEACLRGDSGARRRLLRVAEALAPRDPQDPSRPALERAFQRVWELGGTPPQRSEEEP